MRHSKVSTVPDMTQARLDELIARGQFRPGTTLADIVLNSDWIANHVLDVKPISTTTYTLLTSDDGKVLRFTHAAGCTVTCPNSFSAGYNVGLVQAGAGQVTSVAASGASVVNRQGFTKTAGRYATASLLVDVNSTGTAARYVLGGDCA